MTQRRSGPPPRAPRATGSAAWSDSEIGRRRLVEQGVAVLASHAEAPSLVEWATRMGVYTRPAGSRTWRNPFGPEDGNARMRTRLYRERITRRPELASRLHELAGRVIVCDDHHESAPETCFVAWLVGHVNAVVGPAPKDRRPTPDPAFTPAPERIMVQRGRRPRRAA